MSATNHKAYSNRSGNGSAGVGHAHGGEADPASFSLRDTLNSIRVREANFGEFLAALKQYGHSTAKS